MKSKMMKMINCTGEWTTTSETHCVLGQKLQQKKKKMKIAGHFSSRHD